MRLALLRRIVLDLGLPAAAVSVLAGLALLPFSNVSLSAIGYSLACPIPFLLVAGQRREATRLASETGELRSTGERWLAALIIGAGLVAAALHAWSFAWGIS